MMMGEGGPIRALREFSRHTPKYRCDLCAATIAEEHTHVWSERDDGLLCACRSCAVLFSDPGGEVRSVTTTVEPVLDFDREAWTKLAIPVTPACVFWHNGGAPRVLFPGSFGAAEGHVDESAWRAFVERVPSLNDLAHGKEALVVHLGRSSLVCRASLDLVYRLLGQVRKRSSHQPDELDQLVLSLFATKSESLSEGTA